MTMETAFVDGVWRAFLGEIPSESQLEHVIKILGSEQEFLAWLVTRRGVLGAEPELNETLQDLAHRSTMKPFTRRVESGFPLEYLASRRAMSSAISAVLTADRETATAHNGMHEALLAAAISNRSPEMPSRWSLGIKKAE